MSEEQTANSATAVEETFTVVVGSTMPPTAPW